MKIFNSRRVVLPGFPFGGKFETMDEINDYFKGDKIQCLLCGKQYRALGNHLPMIHDITIDEYKEKYGIPWGRGLVASDLSNIISKDTKRRHREGELSISTEERNKLLKKAIGTKKRKKCKAIVRDEIERGKNALEEYNAMHQAAPNLKRSDLIDKIIELRLSGKTLTEIGNILGCSKNTVARRLEKACVK